MPTIIFTPQLFISGNLVANDDFALTPANTAVNVPVLANDTLDDAPVALEDLAGPPTVVREPWVGEATVESDGTITYVPPAGFCGTVSFDYEIETEEPEGCVTVYNSYDYLYFDEQEQSPPEWWGLAENILVEVPSGTYSGVWESETGSYFGDWPTNCTDEEGTISWADGNVAPLCVSWICPA